MADLEAKLDHLIRLLEDKEMASYHKQCLGSKQMLQELVVNTVLASMLGYFMFRVMDYHFRKG